MWEEDGVINYWWLTTLEKLFFSGTLKTQSLLDGKMIIQVEEISKAKYGELLQVG